MSCSAIRFDAQGAYFVKAPAAVIDVGVDWSGWMAASQVTALDSSTWEADAGVTISAPQSTDGVTSVLVAGGQAGSDYLLTNTITASALVDSRSIRVKVRA